MSSNSSLQALLRCGRPRRRRSNRPGFGVWPAQSTLLFVDEIHRFDLRSVQDGFLPFDGRKASSHPGGRHHGEPLVKLS